MSMWIDKNIHKLNDKKILIFQKVEIGGGGCGQNFKILENFTGKKTSLYHLFYSFWTIKSKNHY